MGSAPGFSQLTFGPRGRSAEGYVCFFVQFPNVTWFAGSDQSDPITGVTCRRVQLQPGDTTEFGGYLRLFNLLRKLPLLP